jgi:two-component system sensor histidine kinase QseC
MKRLHTRLQNALRPSLSRRLFSALLLAFALVAVVLIVPDYLSFRQEFSDEGQHTALIKFARQASITLDTVDNTHDALILMRALQDHTTRARSEAGFAPLLMALSASSGQHIFAAPELAGLQLDAPADQQREQLIHGHSYRVTRHVGQRWTLLTAEPRLSDAHALQLLINDIGPSLLLAFPFVLLPLLLAVHQALRPLRRLSTHMAQRPADDLSPLAINLKYAELQPIIGAFNALLCKLQDKVQRERAFVQDAAHELRTPMAVIAAQAHALTRAASQAERLQAEGALSHAIERASHLARQLLALAALDEPAPSNSVSLDLAHLLQTMLAQCMPAAQARGITLSLDAPETCPVQTERVALQSVIHNLLDNALRHGRAGGQIDVTLQTDAASLTLTVADDGPGIPATERERIFERFVRGGQTDTPGTGLGLAIVKQAVQRLAGEVRLVDGLPKGQGEHGAAFMVTLPARTPMS